MKKQGSSENVNPENGFSVKPYLFLAGMIGGIAFIAFTGYKYILKDRLNITHTQNQVLENSVLNIQSKDKNNTQAIDSTSSKEIIDYLINEKVDLNSIIENY